MPDPVSGGPSARGLDPRDGAGLPEARISHATPNRIRLKVPTRRHDAAFFRAVEDRLAGWRHVERVEVNPVTASILVHFSNPVALMHEAMAGNDLFQITYPQESDEPSRRLLLSHVQEAAAVADGSLRQWSGGSLDLRTAVFTVLLFSGLQQLALGNVAAPAATLLWYAATVLGLPGAPRPSSGELQAI